MTATPNSLRPTPAPNVADVGIYAVPQPNAPVDLRLDGNEGSHPAAELLSEIARAGELLRSYPKASDLELDLGTHLGIAADRVLVTAGGDEALDRVFRAFVEKGRNVVLPEPTFVMLRRYATLARGTVKSVAWPGGAFPIEEVTATIDPHTAVVTIVSPNNPTGAVATADDLARVAAAAPHAVVLVDAAYAEFANHDLTQQALEIPNAVVIRSLSKAWGLAGCRIGYAVGNPEVITMLRGAGSPYSVAGPSIEVARRRLAGDRAAVEEFVTRVRGEVAALRKELEAAGIDSEPSEANFVLATPPDAEALWTGLAGHGIAVRVFPGDPLLGDRVRITCPGDAAKFERLIAALRAVTR